MQVIDSKLLDSNGHINEELFLSQLKSFFPPEKLSLIESAINLLKKNSSPTVRHITGINVYIYAIEMAYILFQIKADEDSVASGLLYDIYSRAVISDEDVENACGISVLKILQGSKKMTAIKMYRSESISLEQIDTFRKMLLTVIEDVRIVLVKIVDKLCTIRHIKSLESEQRLTIARETLDIYAPLANRLGLFQIKWELEDRAFSFLNPEDYKKIAKALGSTRLERESRLEKAKQDLVVAIDRQNIHAEINGRIKHIYSIWKKLKNKGYAGLDRLFDITALRIVVDTVDQCYKALAVVNDIWEPIAEEFTDYIVSPKANGYKSIHTVVYAYEQVLEVQIRTKEMHEESELGFAAHWRYKEGVKFDPSYEARVIWLRSLLAWEKDINQEDQSISQELNKRVYIFTPANELVDLAIGSTVLDFAYSVHTMVGHRTRGAKLNGRIVPLTTKLQTGDKVEILTNKLPNPSKDWALESEGFLFSPRHRSRVTKWFNEQNKEDNIALGKERLTKELKGYNLKEPDYTEVAKKFNMLDADTLFASVENGTIRLKSLVNHILDNYSAEERTVKRGSSFKNDKVDPSKPKSILVSGYSGMKYVFAKCCEPEPNDDIAGYMSVGKGVVIHTTKCPNLDYLKEKNPERFIEVKWINKE